MDPVQLIASFVAILLVAAFAAKLYPVKDVLTEASAIKDYQRYNPDAQIDSCILGKKNQTAIILLVSPAEQLGVVTQLGDRLVCRTVSKGDIASFSVNGNELTLVSNDFTQPKVSIELAPKPLDSTQNTIAAFTAASGGKNAA